MKQILQWVRALVVFIGGLFGGIGANGKRGQAAISGRAPGPLALPATAPVPLWEPIDKARLQQFLSSDTGQRLLARWEARELLSYRMQCSDPMHAAHSSGRARGFSDGREWLISLSRVTCVPVTTALGSAAFAPDGAEADSQQDMQPIEGESELHERFSP